MAPARHWLGDGCPEPHGNLDTVLARWPAETIDALARCGRVATDHEPVSDAEREPVAA